jgi:phospholipase C
LASSNIINAAQNGTLANLSLVMPSGSNSQHNSRSMGVGDNWIGKVMNAIMNGPQWSSPAVFISYDDCGCFYDHVSPPPGDGPRLPMVIASPYAKSGFTDSTVATPESMLAFVEHLFGVPAMAGQEAVAYDALNMLSGVLLAVADPRRAELPAQAARAAGTTPARPGPGRSAHRGGRRGDASGTLRVSDQRRPPRAEARGGARC